MKRGRFDVWTIRDFVASIGEKVLLSLMPPAVEAELADFFAREAEPGGAIFLSRLSETISLAEGEFAHRIDLPDEDYTAGAGLLPALGTVSYV